MYCRMEGGGTLCVRACVCACVCVCVCVCVRASFHTYRSTHPVCVCTQAQMAAARPCLSVVITECEQHYLTLRTAISQLSVLLLLLYREGIDFFF